jgi:hypothetical protein
VYPQKKKVEQVNSFTYLGSIVTKDGDADEDVRSRIRKANGAFIQLYPVWRNRNISERTKLRIFNTNVKSVLLYGCETWKVTQPLTDRLQVSINCCLRSIIHIRWPETISNEYLWKITASCNLDKEEKMALDWSYLRKPIGSIE